MRGDHRLAMAFFEQFPSKDRLLRLCGTQIARKTAAQL